MAQWDDPIGCGCVGPEAYAQSARAHREASQVQTKPPWELRIMCARVKQSHLFKALFRLSQICNHFQEGPDFPQTCETCSELPYTSTMLRYRGVIN